MGNEVGTHKPSFFTALMGLLISGFILIAGIFGTACLAILAIKWFISLIKGGF